MSLSFQTESPVWSIRIGDTLHARTSGVKCVLTGVEVSIFAPPVHLRNRFDTLGVDMHNASVVLRLEYKAPGAVNPLVIVLGGDAQFLSWSKILEEYPNYVKTENPDQRIQATESFNPLDCQVLKVSHHGSKHGTTLECVEVLDPEHAVVSCSGSSAYGFPHEIALLSLKEKTDRILLTDYATGGKPKSGTTVVVSKGTDVPEIVSLGEDRSGVPNPP